MDRLQKWIAIILLLFSIGFNLWLYRAEPTATIDPNDNAFQFALVDRTNQMWDYASRVCPHNLLIINCKLSILADHWVPNWAEGYNLPYYYSHIPQIIIVGSWRFLNWIIGLFVDLRIGLFVYYHIIIYVLLCFFPLSIFLAFRILKLPWLTTGIAALLASQISTDGLYGIDQTSFLWRGWGLSSQLFALIWLPLAIASIMQYTKESSKKIYILSILFLVFTTAGHLGIGMMAFLAIPVICINKNIKTTIKQTFFLALPPLIILSYWIVPAFLNNNYHNISVWDPVWKFNSFGAKEVVTMLAGGQLFDFGRFPLFTALVFIGLFVDWKLDIGNWKLLFLFYLALFFGRTTWGGLLNFIPGMSEFHQHRFIVGIHLAGLFLAPIGLTWLIDTVSKKYIPQLLAYVCIGVFVYWILVPQTLSYASYNTTLIQQANDAYTKVKPDFEELLLALRSLGEGRGRVYALRGSEGKAFALASTPYYMQLSTYGIPTVLWLPETWSMNSDTEQFFVEENPSHYALYNIRYVVAPPTRQAQPFWNLLKETPSWKLYTVETDGYITVSTAPSVVTSKKTDLINLVHLWIQSDYPGNHIFPEFSNPNTSLPRFRMTDPVTYITPDGTTHNLFAEPPVYQNPSQFQIPASVTSQSSDTDMVFKATVEITAPCPTCVVILKQTYHPNWIVTVNGKKEKTINVFPFFTAIRLEEPGTYDVVFSYTSS